MKYEFHGYATKGISRTYHNWYQMIRRCHDERVRDFKDYGGRGIKVCARWRKSITNFVADMGEAPKGKTLDRINNNGNYNKKNCRWATRKEQRANQRTAKNALLYKGKPIKQLAKERGIKYVTLHARIHRYGWSIERALNTVV